MPRYEPVPESKMLDRCNYYTTCEVLREIYLEASRLPSWPDKIELLTKIRLASAMAKATTKLLYKYEPNYLDILFDTTKDVKRNAGV